MLVPEDILSPTQLCEKRWDELSISCCGNTGGKTVKHYVYSYHKYEENNNCCHFHGKPSLVMCHECSVMNCEQFKSAKEKLWSKDGVCNSYYFLK